ncbi:MAG: DUF2237 domain-containing protein [Pseudomonadota bacterium]
MTDDPTFQMSESLNVLGEPLKPCGFDPMTGFFRDGCCNTGPTDAGRHVVCVRVTDDFLTFSRSRGNDLSTPRPEYGFQGLRQGDRWCVCVDRWKEAWEAGKAPKVILASTHISALSVVPLEVLEQFAIAPPPRRH